RVIACLEDEKEALTLAMADRLRDFQELVHVKTSLSLEVATYRALLEGESNPEVFLTERIETKPQEFRNTSYQYTNSVLQREKERNLFPRQKTPSANFIQNSVLLSNRWAHPRSQSAIGDAARRGIVGSGYPPSATTWQENTYEKAVNSYEKTANSQTNFRTFSPTYGLLRNTEAQVKTFPDRPRTEGTKEAPANLAKQSTVAQQSSWECQDSVAAGASRSTWSNERTVILGKKTEAKASREQDRNRPGTVQTKREEKMFDSKEKASEERNLRWEELTKLDKEARKRESQQMLQKAKEKESPQEKSVRERERPISLEVPQDSTPHVAPKGVQMPLKKDAGDVSGRGVETRETRFRLDTSDTPGSLTGDSMTETIAENIVSSILKQFAQSPDTEASADSFPDTKVTYVNRKELPRDRKTKTEMVVESKLTEEIDVSDDAGLDYLLSKDVKEVELKGKSAERMIGDMINLGLKGREGKARVVNVEIIEEPMSYVGGEKADEFSTPFEVEEVDDVSPGSKELAGEEEGYGETGTMFSGYQRTKTKQSQESRTHVEEVMEAGDSEGEQSYFVSTPDEHPGGHDRDEGSVYGQIHIEEESTIRYSWQDEIVPGSRRKIKRDSASGEKTVKPLDVPEPSLEKDVGYTHWKEQASGEFHAEPTVIEKEIKIPHEFQTSIKGDFKEPRHQLVEVIGQLEESLPERMKEELSALTSEGQGGPGNVSIDVKKVQTSGGRSVTLVAEVNLSKTVDAAQLDLELLSKDEASEIEKAVESVVQDNLAKGPSSPPGSPDREAGAEAPAAGFHFKRWATQELYKPSDEDGDASQASSSTEWVTSQGPVSATVEVTSPRGFAQSHVLEDVNQSVRHIKIGPTGIWKTEQVSPEGPTAEVVEVSGEGDLSQAAGLAGASWSVRHFTWGSDQSQLSKEVFFQGPVPAFQEAEDTEKPSLVELSTGTDGLGRHSAFGSKEFHANREIILQGPISGTGKVDYFQTEESVGTQTSVKHLHLGPRDGFSEQIQFTVPLSDQMELGVREGAVHTPKVSRNSTSIRPVKIRLQEYQNTEQTVPLLGEFSDSESSAHREGLADVIQAIPSYTVDRKTLVTEKNTLQRAVSQPPQEASVGGMSGAEVTSGMSRSFRHIQLGPGEATTSEHIVHGPISKTFVLAGSADSPELGELADSSRMLRQVALGPKETSFTFQMDVSNIEATPSWTREATVPFPTGTEAAHNVSDRGTWRDAGSRNDQAAGVSSQGSAGDRRQALGEKSKEQAEFDKTVQLQRMVDQRSVISDEKKVALLYLDNQEEENEGHWF
ncbi:hypothetical protein MC885_016715, partial [Smutsia gigantea]